MLILKECKPIICIFKKIVNPHLNV